VTVHFIFVFHNNKEDIMTRHQQDVLVLCFFVVVLGSYPLIGSVIAAALHKVGWRWPIVITSIMSLAFSYIWIFGRES